MGDPVSLKRANRLEANFRDHPSYESDQALLLRMQSGEQHWQLSITAYERQNDRRRKTQRR
jgi:hypothetical protein